MAKESQAIARKLQELQNHPQHPSVAMPLTSQSYRAALPPHLSQTPTFTGTTSEKVISTKDAWTLSIEPRASRSPPI